MQLHDSQYMTGLGGWVGHCTREWAYAFERACHVLILHPALQVVASSSPDKNVAADNDSIPASSNNHTPQQQSTNTSKPTSPGTSAPGTSTSTSGSGAGGGFSGSGAGGRDKKKVGGDGGAVPQQKVRRAAAGSEAVRDQIRKLVVGGPQSKEEKAKVYAVSDSEDEQLAVEDIRCAQILRYCFALQLSVDCHMALSHCVLLLCKRKCHSCLCSGQLLYGKFKQG